MVSEIANYIILGRPFFIYFGILALLSLLFTASISFLNVRGIHFIPFKWHPRMAVLTIILALAHAIMVFSRVYGF